MTMAPHAGTFNLLNEQQRVVVRGRWRAGRQLLRFVLHTGRGGDKASCHQPDYESSSAKSCKFSTPHGVVKERRADRSKPGHRQHRIFLGRRGHQGRPEGRGGGCVIVALRGRRKDKKGARERRCMSVQRVYLAISERSHPCPRYCRLFSANK